MSATHAPCPTRPTRTLCGRHLDPPFVRVGKPVTCGLCLRAAVSKSDTRLPITDQRQIARVEWDAWHGAFLNYVAIHGVTEVAKRLHVASQSVTHWCHKGKPSRGAFERILSLLRE